MLLAFFVAGCPSSGSSDGNFNTDPEAVRQRLQTTLDDLAAFGDKRAGTDPGRQAGEYLRQRFETIGLEDVAFESFTFPFFSFQNSSLSVTADGAPLAMNHEVLAYSGSGSVDATVVHVGGGHADAYQGLDVTGAVVLVESDMSLHRTAQYRLVVDHGGAAMVFVSAAPDNLVQIGMVSDGREGLGPVPVVTVGSDDGQQMIDALAGGQTVRAQIEVNATLEPAEGRNVVGWLYGTEPDGSYLLVGGHYDTWYTGAIDNGTGVAAVIELAETLIHRGTPRYSIAFVGFDAEEVGLYGGYDFLRKHVAVANEPMLAFVNLDQPANDVGGTRVVGHTRGGGMGDAVTQAGLHQLYDFVGTIDLIPMSTGRIPGDIEGMYWYGIQGYTSGCQSPWYHTPEDTPDKLDMDFFVQVMPAHVSFLELLDQLPVESLQVHDPTVWKIEATTAPSGNDLTVTALVRDADDTAQDGASVWVRVYVDDNTSTHTDETVTGSDGSASVLIPESALTAGQGPRWLYVLAGEDYPLALSITALP
jgi:hypothetical protein